MSGRNEWDSSQLRKYDLNLEPIHRLHYKDPKVDELMKANVRVFNNAYLEINLENILMLYCIIIILL